MRRILQAVAGLVGVTVIGLAAIARPKAPPAPEPVVHASQAVDAILADGAHCPPADTALPLIESIVAQADSLEPPAREELLKRTAGPLLARAVQCQLWIRAQALTFDDKQLSEASLGARIAAAIEFERARAQFVVFSSTPASAVEGLKLLHRVGLKAEAGESILRNASSLALGFPSPAMAEATLPVTYRAKLTEEIVSGGAKLLKRRRGACAGGLERLPPQLETLQRDYQYPATLNRVLAECSNNNSGGIS